MEPRIQGGAPRWPRSAHTSRYPLGATTLRPALGAGRAFRRDALAFLREQRREGGLVRFRVGFTDYALVTEPELVRRVLVTQHRHFGEGKWTQRGHRLLRDCLITREGASHRERRALLQAAFDERHLAAHADAIASRAEHLGDTWTEGRELDLRFEMARLALVVAGEALFGADLEPDSVRLARALDLLRGEISRLPRPRAELRAALRILRGTAARIDGGEVARGLREAGLEEAAIADEIVSLLFASADTTPSALAWTWLALARHPEVEEKLLAELAEALGGRLPVREDLSRLPYLDLVTTEVLRLHPPVHFIDRRVLVDVEWEGARLRAGEYVLLSPLLTQRDPRFFEAPEEFRPERWRDADRRVHRAFFPFGAGPHACIGRKLAQMEIALAVATLAPRWRLVPGPDLPADPRPQTSRFPMRPERRR